MLFMNELTQRVLALLNMRAEKVFIPHLTGESSPPPRGVRGIRSARWGITESQRGPIGSGLQNVGHKGVATGQGKLRQRYIARRKAVSFFEDARDLRLCSTSCSVGDERKPPLMEVSLYLPLICFFEKHEQCMRLPC